MNPFDGLAKLMVLIVFASASLYILRIYLTVKHPHIREAWDEAEAKRIEKQKKVAGGAFNAGLGIAKFFLKK